MKHLEAHIIDSKNGLHYTLHGDYYLPDLETEAIFPPGKYGNARLQYLQNHHAALYERLLLAGKLNEDLHQADIQAQRLLDMMMPDIAREAGATETLKASNPMKWVGIMNAIKAQVEEIIWKEIIAR